ncbi:MAG: homoserine kinase, partial [Acidobacteria bacterium]
AAYGYAVGKYAFVAALGRDDLALVGRSIEDRLVEPLRARLIPGFDAVKRAALDAGGLGCSIAGSGPSVFAFADSLSAATKIGDAMQAAFRSAAGLDSDLFAGKVSRDGARVL